MQFDLTSSLEFSSFSHTNSSDFKSKLLFWAEKFDVFCFLDSNSCEDRYGKYDFIIGIDSLTEINCIDNLIPDKFQFGYIKYDWKNCFFFEPRYILYSQNGKLFINRNMPEAIEILTQILALNEDNYSIPKLKFEVKTSESEYESNVIKIQTDIRNGRYYELNYCVEFLAENAYINPISTFIQINQIAKSPMTALVKHKAEWILSYSPERLIAKRIDRLIAQPIKGTARRNLTDLAQDEIIKTELKNNIKERAENTMIVDLMRHDLTPYAQSGSITVTELCEVYTFPFVHQMISTIEAQLSEKSDSIVAFKNILPAGSMTGAPKIEVMKAIAEIENFERGFYAGNIGYIDSEGDFDFNVVIRTLIYNAENKIVKLNVGSAITILSEVDLEYKECLLKAEGILKFFR